MNRATPLTIREQVCLVCGSPSPDEASPDCTHTKVARFADLPPSLRDMVHRVLRAKAFLTSAMVTLEKGAQLEAAAGRAVIDDDSDVYSPGPNVHFLHRRGELVRPPTEPPRSSSSTPVKPPMVKLSEPMGPKPPPLKLKTPKAPKRRNPNPPPPSPRRSTEDTTSGSLFTPPPSTGEGR